MMGDEMAIHETKQMIIDTAFALFKEKGYDNVTLNEICEACGITKTTFYYHLSSKEEIISRFYEGVTSTLAERLLKVVAAENYWEQLMAMFNALIDSTESIGPGLLGQLMIMNLRKDEGTFDMDDNLTRVAVVLVERAQKAGQIRNKSAALPLYRAACHAFEGYELLWCIKNGAYDRKAALRQAFEQIFDTNPELRDDKELFPVMGMGARMF
jgi:AcrR family transcriptional regulator